MSNLTVESDGVVRELVPFGALPASVQADFDYITEDDQWHDRFVFYRDSWYDTSDVQSIRVSKVQDRPMGWAMYVDPDSPFAAWHAVISETFFSGILFRHVYDDPDHDDGVVCGHYYS